MWPHIYIHIHTYLYIYIHKHIHTCSLCTHTHMYRYTSPAQYEKHTLLATIAKEEDTIERLRMQVASKSGGVMSPELRTPSVAVTPVAPPLAKGEALAKGLQGTGLASGEQHVLLQRQKLTAEIAREKVADPSFFLHASLLKKNFRPTVTALARLARLPSPAPLPLPLPSPACPTCSACATRHTCHDLDCMRLRRMLAYTHVCSRMLPYVSRTRQHEMATLESELGPRGATLGTQTLASALVSDLRGTSGSGDMTGTEAYNARSDVRYMGDKMVPTDGKGGLSLELAGAVPDGLEIDK